MRSTDSSIGTLSPWLAVLSGRLQDLEAMVLFAGGSTSLVVIPESLQHPVTSRLLPVALPLPPSWCLLLAPLTKTNSFSMSCCWLWCLITVMGHYLIRQICNFPAEDGEADELGGCEHQAQITMTPNKVRELRPEAGTLVKPHLPQASL